MIQYIYKNEGITRGFYKGITLNLIRVNEKFITRVLFPLEHYGL